MRIETVDVDESEKKRSCEAVDCESDEAQVMRKGGFGQGIRLDSSPGFGYGFVSFSVDTEGLAPLISSPSTLLLTFRVDGTGPRRHGSRRAFAVISQSLQASPSPYRHVPVPTGVFMRSNTSAVLALSASASAALLLVSSVVLAEEKPKLPDPIPVEGFQQLLPRGAIAALVDPEFVPASEAEIPDDAWILGFVSEGQAFAYDLNLLNHHEVVNHGTEKSRFAAVW